MASRLEFAGSDIRRIPCIYSCDTGVAQPSHPAELDAVRSRPQHSSVPSVRRTSFAPHRLESFQLLRLGIQAKAKACARNPAASSQFVPRASRGGRLREKE